MPAGHTNDPVSLDDLVGVDFDEIPVEEAVATLGLLVDAGSDAGSSAALTRATEVATTLRARIHYARGHALLYYLEGNAWSALSALRSKANEEGAWEWEAPDLERKIVALRCARTSPGFAHLSLYRRCQVLTNLASAMSNVGRLVEAIAHWDEALDLDRNFAMALGSKGDGLRHYIPYLYDDGHQQVYAKLAFVNLSRALDSRLESREIEQHLQEARADLTSRVPDGFFDLPVTLPETSLGTADEEIRYRRWCLERRLFLNPMNDVLDHEAVSHDILNLPTFTGPIDEFLRAQTWIRLYNAMKQEYVAARLLLYESDTAPAQHFADREVQFANTLDDTIYGIGLERAKVAFRLAYSVLDKTGFFVNDYFALGVDERRVSFRTIWYERGNLRPEFVGRRNLTMRGLFWLSKDLDARGHISLQESLDPDARGLAEFRNALEHRYVRVHGETEGSPPDADVVGALEPALSAEQVHAKALKMLRKARAALTYLSLAVRVDQGRFSDEGAALVIDPELLQHATK